MQREKSQELREKVKLLFNDPISHRNPHNTEVYLAKAPNRSKHPDAIHCGVRVNMDTLKAAPTQTCTICRITISYTHALTTAMIRCIEIFEYQSSTAHTRLKIIFITFFPFHELLCFRLHFMEVLSKVLDKIYGSNERTWVWPKKE